MNPKLQSALIHVGVFVVIAFLGIIILPTLLIPFGVFIAAAMGTFAAAAIANAITLRIFERGRLSDVGLGWTASSRRNLAVGLLGGILAGAIVLLGPVAMRMADLEAVPKEQTHWASILFISVVLLFGAIGEEMLLRGYAFQLLVRAAGPFATILPTSVIFALLHANNPNFGFLAGFNTFLFGVLLGYSFLRSGDLWLPIGIHFGWNWALPLLGVNLSGLTIGVTGYTMHWKIGGLWSGGAYGPEGGLLTTAIVVLLYFYLEKAPLMPQEPYLLFKDREL
ncbi:MAG TPA: type II CAAX endopeptidase family protein [Bryobacteraceae bacterium]|nr:type II CAAX endopeptidase family protein [Bryobacteraceae bacterium]